MRGLTRDLGSSLSRQPFPSASPSIQRGAAARRRLYPQQLSAPGIIDGVLTLVLLCFVRDGGVYSAGTILYVGAVIICRQIGVEPAAAASYSGLLGEIR